MDRRPWLSARAHREEAPYSSRIGARSCSNVHAGSRRILRTIWDARAAQVFDTDAWVPLIKRLNSIVSALAVLISDTTTSHAQTFGEQINVLLLPCRVFTDETEAVAWLSSLEG